GVRFALSTLDAASLALEAHRTLSSGAYGGPARRPLAHLRSTHPRNRTGAAPSESRTNRGRLQRHLCTHSIRRCACRRYSDSEAERASHIDAGRGVRRSDPTAAGIEEGACPEGADTWRDRPGRFARSGPRVAVDLGLGLLWAARRWDRDRPRRAA